MLDVNLPPWEHVRVTCVQCGAAAVIPAPRVGDPDSAVECQCCPVKHHHGQAANGCPVGHGECPDPAACGVAGVGRGDDPGAPCPGGHCGLGVDGCAVCRPVVITWPASAAGPFQAAAGNPLAEVS